MLVQWPYKSKSQETTLSNMPHARRAIPDDVLNKIIKDERAAIPLRLCDQPHERPARTRLSPTMRQMHIAGERLFVDYADSKLQIVDAAC